MQLQNSNRGTLLVAFAALSWGTAGGIAGILTREGWSPSVLALYRGGIGFIMMLVWLLLLGGGYGLRDRRLWCWAALAGLGVAGNILFYFTSIKHGSVAVAATLMYSAPVYVYLIALFSGMERLSFRKLLLIAVAVSGVILLTGVYAVDASGLTVKGVGTGLLSGVCYAIFLFAFKTAALYGSPQTILTVALGVVVLTLSVGADPVRTLQPALSADWPLFLALGVLGAGLSFFLYVAGIQWTPPTMAAITAMVEPLTAVLFAVLLLGETLDYPQTAGMALILFAASALGLGSSGNTSSRHARGTARASERSCEHSHPRSKPGQKP